jgi:uncharacterized protein YoxC
MSIVGLILLICGTILSFFGTYFSDKQSTTELSSKIQEKNNTIDEINSTNKDLISQNKDMIEKVGNYQADIEKRNEKILALEREIDQAPSTALLLSDDVNLINHDNSRGLRNILKIIEKEPQSVKGKLAIKTLDKLQQDYYNKDEVKTVHGTDEFFRQTGLPKIQNEPKNKLALRICQHAISTESIWVMYCCIQILNELGYGSYQIFDLNGIVELEKKLK